MKNMPMLRMIGTYIGALIEALSPSASLPFLRTCSTEFIIARPAESPPRNRYSDTRQSQACRCGFEMAFNPVTVISMRYAPIPVC